MNENINLCEILKDCPNGMELNCTLWDNVKFDHVDMKSNYPIYIKKPGGQMEYLTENGCFNFDLGAKCVIFPKGKTTWKGFRRPFKDGDIVATTLGSVFYLNTRFNTEERYGCFVGISGNGSFYVCKPFAYKECCEFATEEEKRKLFQAIKDNGYKWNTETQTLEKLSTPNFKVGDIIWNKDYYKVKITNVNIEDSFYTYESLIAKGIGTITFNDQYDWKLVEYQIGDHFINPSNNSMFVITKIQNNGNYSVESLGEIYYPFEMKKLDVDRCTKINKWNPKRLKPFTKVLIRDSQHDSWVAVSFSHIDSTQEFPYVTSYAKSKYCIPYNSETEYLVGTTLEEPEFYKC